MGYIGDYRDQEDRLAKVLGVEDITIDPESLTQFEFEDFVALVNNPILVSPRELQAQQDTLTAMGVFCMVWMYQSVQSRLTLTADMIEGLPEDMAIRCGTDEEGNWTFMLVDKDTNEAYSTSEMLMQFTEDVEKGEYDTNNSVDFDIGQRSEGDNEE